MFFRIIPVAVLYLASTLAALSCEGQLVNDEAVYASPLCVPSEPRRIVVMDHSFALGIGLELDLPIVGAPLSRMSDKALHARAENNDVEDLGFVTEPSLERIVALQPDLIIGFTGDKGLAESFYPMLSNLAPTLLDVSGDWKKFYEVLGNMFGRQEKVEAVFSSFETRLEYVRKRVPKDVKVSIVRITPWDFQVYTDTPGAYAPFQVLSETGLKRSAYETAPNGPSLKRPDWEELGLLEGDILLYIVGGTNDSAVSGRHEEVLGNPLWQLIPAVEAGRVHRIDPAIWMEFSGLPSAHRVLDDIERLIIADE